MDFTDGLQLYDIGFLVDVGEDSLFYAEWKESSSYRVIDRTFKSVVVHVQTPGEADLCICIKWSMHKRPAQSRGTLCMEECEELDYVPVCYEQMLFSVGRTYVGMTIREYIHGYTARSVWHLLTDSEREALKCSVTTAMMQMSKKTCGVFGYVQGRNLATSNPCMFLNYRIMLSKMMNEIHGSDMSIISQDTFRCFPTLCHRSLTLDHIILRENRLVGIVGWSRADYFPETFDRLSYFFNVGTLGFDNDWLRFLSTVPCFKGPVPPLFYISCMYYHYYLSIRSTPVDLQPRVDELLNEVVSIQFPNDRWAAEEDQFSDVDNTSDKDCTSDDTEGKEHKGDKVSHSQHDSATTVVNETAPVFYNKEDPFSDINAVSVVSVDTSDIPSRRLSNDNLSIQTWEFEEDTNTVRDILESLA